jgi:hypothetical protein
VEKLVSKLNTEMKDLMQLKNNHSCYQSYFITVKKKDKIRVLTRKGIETVKWFWVLRD